VFRAEESVCPTEFKYREKVTYLLFVRVSLTIKMKEERTTHTVFVCSESKTESCFFLKKKMYGRFSSSLTCVFIVIKRTS